MKIQFIAQSGFIITTDQGDVLIIDPWLDNPKFPVTTEDIPKVDFVFITHDHKDHGLDTGIELAIRDHATFVSGYDIVRHAQEKGVQSVESANIGGPFTSGNLSIVLIHAEHSSDIGVPVGFVIKTDDLTLYHMGDTGYFAHLDTIGVLYDIDVLMVPIGSRYTMGPAEAQLAIEDIGPEIVIPMHYNTFDKIAQNGEEFKNDVERRFAGIEVKLLQPGEQISI